LDIILIITAYFLFLVNWADKPNHTFQGYDDILFGQPLGLSALQP
jgi:hypothetical protein